MKLKRSVVLLAVFLLVFSFVGCDGGGLNGTYVSQGFIQQKFIFEGNRVTLSAFGINASGTYVIHDGLIDISYTMLGNEYKWSQTFSKSGNTINIGGTEFKKS